MAVEKQSYSSTVRKTSVKPIILALSLHVHSAMFSETVILTIIKIWNGNNNRWKFYPDLLVYSNWYDRFC